MEYPVVNKRAIEIPNVGLNETLLKTLEQQFSSVGGDKIADGKYLHMYILNCVCLFHRSSQVCTCSYACS